MKKTHISAAIIVSLVLVGLLALVSPTTLAADVGVNVGVTLSQTPLELSVLSNMNFGELTIPSSEAAVWTINLDIPTFSLSKTGGNSVDVTALDHTPGAVLVGGAPSLTVAYSALVTTNFSATGLNLSNPTLSEYDPGGFPPGTIALVVGADLTIATNASPGVYSDAVITVTVNYE